ncbi:MAG TPA: heme exporter protein CcmD [Pseudolabrys sp.]|nr:heme exporter protein CcmD [Pseudolabrys sp.]
MTLGPHASFIIASYIVTAFVVIAMILWIIADYATQRRILRELEARGVRRRSQNASEDTQ